MLALKAAAQNIVDDGEVPTAEHIRQLIDCLRQLIADIDAAVR
jgi:hypothetical protein